MNKEEIEELAFKDRKELANLNELDLLEIIEFLQLDRKQWINQFSKTHNESIDIQKEKQELKQKYLNAVADYETTMSELQELKKQLEEKNNSQIFIDTQDMEERYAEGLYQEYLEEENKKYKNQQKKFIKWLEDEKDRLARECSHIYENSLGKTRFVNEDIFNEVDTILSKYKSINRY